MEDVDSSDEDELVVPEAYLEAEYDLSIGNYSQSANGSEGQTRQHHHNH